jgi:type VII secretion protein EccB
MASRSDQLHSHQFALQRVVGALAMRDADPSSSPMRRIGGALFASVMLAALGLAAVGVYGLLKPGGNERWRDGASVIVEEETGARFVFLDGVLHPVLNQTSALLAVGSAQPKTALVSRASLASVPRGLPLGIPGAPDPLPPRAALLDDRWSVCSRPSAAGRAESVLLMGSVGEGAPVAEAEGMLVADARGEAYLLWRNARYAVRDKLVLDALWAGERPVVVAPALLNALPPAPDLRRIPLDRTGGSALSGAEIGQVFVHTSQGAGKKYAVAVAGGLADITQVQADLLLADPDNPNPRGRPSTLSQADYGRAPKADPLETSAAPAATPKLVTPAAGGGVCASYADGAGAPDVTLVRALAPARGEARAGGVWQGTVVADWVRVPPGHGAVVEAVAAPTAGAPGGAGASVGALAVVTDQGVRYPVPSADVLAMLGYSGVRPVRLPASVVALLPGGRSLDPADARAPAPPP